MQALFPWGQFKARRVPVPPPSALSLPKAAGAHLARVWQRRPKTKFVLCIRDPAYTKGLGRRWLLSPHGQGHSNPSAPRPSGKPQTCTHAHTRTRGKGGPQGLGGQREKEEKVAISPKPCQHRAKKSALLAQWRWGAQRCQEHPCPTPRRSSPGTTPRRDLRHPASSHVALKTNFFFCRPFASLWRH